MNSSFSLEISQTESKHNVRRKSEEQPTITGTSSVFGTVFNFTNSIIGAGAIGLGGAFALSGGIVSIISILFFAFVNKRSLDLVVSLAIQIEGSGGSYESLGTFAYGATGRIAVMVSKMLYSLGGLIAYVIVVKDNFGPGLGNLIYRDQFDIDTSITDQPMNIDWFHRLILNDEFLTLIISTAVILPLCLLRDMAPLAKFSFISVVAMCFIVLIVIYLHGTTDMVEIEHSNGSGFYQDWVIIKSGFFESTGTFVFTFVCQNTVFLAYDSIDPRVRSLETWKKISFYSILISTIVSLTVGIFVYITFWQSTPSDIFQIYPSSVAVDCAKLLLSTTMLLTCPLPFFTCREMIIVMITDMHDYLKSFHGSTSIDLEIPLISKDEPRLDQDLEESSTESSIKLDAMDTISTGSTYPFLLPGNSRQLVLSYHVLLTLIIWSMVTTLAILTPSLGDVLDLVGSATGTAIAFVLPALFSFKIIGFTFEGLFLLVIGGAVGCVGTVFSLKKLVTDFSA